RHVFTLSVAGHRVTATDAHAPPRSVALIPSHVDTAVFVLHWDGVPRDLHSFPTRRSSDLSDRRNAAAFKQPQNQGQGQGYGQVRSEEHTSELQSRENLVCRLLLEKKKLLTIAAGRVATASNPLWDNAALYHTAFYIIAHHG